MKGFRKASLVFACMMLLLGTGFYVSLADSHHAYTFTFNNRGKGVTTTSVYKGATSTTAGVIISYSTAPQYMTTYCVQRSDTSAVITGTAEVQNTKWQGERMEYKSGYSTKRLNVRLYGIASSLTAPSGIRVSGQWTAV